MKASDIFKANEREYFESIVAVADVPYQWGDNPHTPYRSWLFRESSSIPGAIVLTTQSEKGFAHLILFYHIRKKAWVSEMVDPSSYFGIYSSSKFEGIDQIIEDLSDFVYYKVDRKYCSKYMITAPVEQSLQLDEDAEEASAFRMS